MGKLIHNGQVAIVYSPGVGISWSMLYEDGSMALDGEVALWISVGDTKMAIEVAKRKWPERFHAGLAKAKIMWVPEGSRFFLSDVDGSERVHVTDGLVGEYYLKECWLYVA